MSDDQREDAIRRLVLADSFFLLVSGGVLVLFWFAAPWFGPVQDFLARLR